MSSLLSAFITLSLTAYLCSGQSYVDGEASTFNTTALSGSFTDFFGENDSTIQLNKTAINNTAESVSGNARSGNSLFFAGKDNGFLKNSSFDLINLSSSNKAISQTGTAVSGQQIVFNQILQGSSTNVTNTATDNEAFVSGVYGDGKPSAIAGAETQALTLNDSDFFVTNDVNNNIASNTFTGKSVAGSATSVKFANNATMGFYNNAEDNSASNSDGRAIAGSQNNVYSSQDSSITISSNSTQNSATAEGGEAVSGVQNNFGTLKGQINEDTPTLQINDRAVDNIAIAIDDGKAVAGVSTNIDTLQDGDVQVSLFSEDNRATTSGSGETPQNADAGVVFNAQTVVDSKLNITAQAYDNKAFNYNNDDRDSSDAIAGIAVTIGDISGTQVVTDLTSKGNFAKADYGDAISGNRIEVQKSGAGNTFDNTLTAEYNTAQAARGDAVIDSEFNILS